MSDLFASTAAQSADYDAHSIEVPGGARARPAAAEDVGVPASGPPTVSRQ
jgi:hypothetical protein